MTPRLFLPPSPLAPAVPNETSVANPVDLVEQLFTAFGDCAYEDRRAEPVTALEHALQCAQLAEWSEARPELVAAALLHDIGHFIGTESVDDSEDDAHERRALPLLERVFGAAVAEPVRLHVAAKRYLVTTSADYRKMLSPASLHTLRLQGGPMSKSQAKCFREEPYAMDAVMLRRWDDLAKEPGKRTAPLSYYLQLLEDLRSLPAEPRVCIGAGNLS